MEQFIRPGDTFHSLWNDDRLKVVDVSEEQLVVEFRHLPGRPRINREHFHHLFAQAFTILSGEATCMIDGETFTASEGETVHVAVGQLHHDPRPIDEKLIYRSTIRFSENGLENGTRMVLWFATIFGLSYEDGIAPSGLPKNPLQLMVSLDESVNGLKYDSPQIPGGVKPVLALGARIGRLFGYRPWYERHLPERNSTQPTRTSIAA